MVKYRDFQNGEWPLELQDENTVVCAGMISVSKIEDISPVGSYLTRVRLA